MGCTESAEGCPAGSTSTGEGADGAATDVDCLGSEARRHARGKDDEQCVESGCNCSIQLCSGESPLSAIVKHARAGLQKWLARSFTRGRAAHCMSMLALPLPGGGLLPHEALGECAPRRLAGVAAALFVVLAAPPLLQGGRRFPQAPGGGVGAEKVGVGCQVDGLQQVPADVHAAQHLHRQQEVLEGCLHRRVLGCDLCRQG